MKKLLILLILLSSVTFGKIYTTKGGKSLDIAEYGYIHRNKTKDDYIYVECWNNFREKEITFVAMDDPSFKEDYYNKIMNGDYGIIWDLIPTAVLLEKRIDNANGTIQVIFTREGKNKVMRTGRFYIVPDGKLAIVYLDMGSNSMNALNTIGGND